LKEPSEIVVVLPKWHDKHALFGWVLTLQYFNILRTGQPELSILASW
jgi:hypothetical protein